MPLLNDMYNTLFEQIKKSTRKLYRPFASDDANSETHELTKHLLLYFNLICFVNSWVNLS
jgi:hypothetical protein